MARQKKVDPFDFKAQFPNLGDGEALLSEKYSEQEIYEKARDFIKAERKENAGAHYWIAPKIDAIENGSQPLTFLSPYDWNSLKDIIVSHGDPVIVEHHAKFVEWYDANPVAQEVYTHCAKSAYSFRDTNNKYVNGHRYSYGGIDTVEKDIEKLREAYRAHPLNAFNFEVHAYSQEGRQYAESHREQKFQEGDIVVLRAPFVGNHRYDPHYRNAEMKPEDLRYGTVMLADTDKFNYRSRGGKGSRLINVMWMGTEDAETVALPERCLKWESRKRS